MKLWDKRWEQMNTDLLKGHSTENLALKVINFQKKGSLGEFHMHSWMKAALNVCLLCIYCTSRYSDTVSEKTCDLKANFTLCRQLLFNVSV